MTEFTDTVRILRVGRFREADVWVRFLSPSRGLLSAFAFGGSRSRRRFSGCLDLFNEVLFSVKASRGGRYLALQEGVLMRGTTRLRTDWKRLGMAMNCLHFLEAFGVSPDSAYAVHTLFENVLDLLESDQIVPLSLPIWFRARLAFDQGYFLDLGRCGRCGEDLSSISACSFSVAEGMLVCETCSRHANGAFLLRASRETLDALRHVQESLPIHWQTGATAALTAAGRRESARLIDALIQHHVGLYWNNRRFARS